MHNGWRRVLLGDVLKLEISQVKVDPLATYRLAGVYSFGRGLFERERLLGAKTSYKVLHRLRPGQLVMSKLKAWEGALAVVPETFDEFVLSPEFSTFTTSDDLDPHFLTLLCGQPSFWQILQGRSRGIGGRRERVHPTQLLGIPITLPPLRGHSGMELSPGWLLQHLIGEQAAGQQHEGVEGSSRSWWCS